MLSTVDPFSFAFHDGFLQGDETVCANSLQTTLKGRSKAKHTSEVRTWKGLTLLVSPGKSQTAFSPCEYVMACVRPYGGCLVVSEELLLWDFPRHRWKSREPRSADLFSLCFALHLIISLCLSVSLSTSLSSSLSLSLSIYLVSCAQGDSDRSIRETERFY